MPEKPEKLEKPEEPEEKNADKMPDRPLECSECKKPIAIRYTEVIGHSNTQSCMCSDCPELQKRIHGTSGQRQGHEAFETKTGLACGNCGTTLDGLRVGASLGCSECYQVFDHVILSEILATGKLPLRLETAKKTDPIHIGRAPGESQELNPSLRLLALNEALNETLKKEDYEQAAWLRDQIKALTEHSEKKSDDGKQ
jgi:protein arginine kinase activator